MSRTQTIPSSLHFTGVTEATKYGQGEYRSACVKCGGDSNSDRFILLEVSKITGGPFAFCRKCGYKTSLKSTDKWVVLSEEERAKFAAERLRREKEDVAKIEVNREHFRKVPWWETYNHALQHYPHAVELWRSRYGINNWALEYYKLGYCKDFGYMHNGEKYVSETLTIPIFEPGTNYKIINMRHRLLSPEAKGGRYRPAKAGLGQSLFFANLGQRMKIEERREPGNPIAANKVDYKIMVVVEGAIKAISIWQSVMSEFMEGIASPETIWFHANVQVIGIPGTNLHKRNEPLLESANRIYLVLDPDAVEDRKDEQLAEQLGTNRTRSIYLPGKPDDLIISGTLNIKNIVMLMKQSRRF